MNDIFCGLKLTHDGCMAVIRKNELIFSIEAEKLENRPRYSPLNTWRDLVAVLDGQGLRPDDLTSVAVDGWGRTGGADAPTLHVVDDAGNSRSVPVAAYRDQPGTGADPLSRPFEAAALFGDGLVKFRSFSHATDHALASYCSSPFAARNQPALIVVWDGGMAPCLYHYDPAHRTLRPLRWLLDVLGGLYPVFATHLAPFRTGETALDTDVQKLETVILPVSGKAMAYAALGAPDDEAMAVMAATSAAHRPADLVRMYVWSRTVLRELAPRKLSDATLIASLQKYLGDLLAESLGRFLTEHQEFRRTPLCLSGGCALNIKWNARIRDSGLFPDVWVPPFPNDAGSAIGAACAEMIDRTGRSDLHWSVFAGPEVPPAGDLPAGWASRPCTLDELAELLAVEGEPVVVLTGRAEIGPRALGHRSIIAPATDAGMRDRLNDLKQRAYYRPVAPICLQESAPEVFSPGTRDPHMLFEHQVRPQWRDRIPAVVHIDASARLQTVGPDNPAMYELLLGYQRRTGIPVLCNTSANLNGSGFFPDVASALRWGKVRYVWSEGTLLHSSAGRFSAGRSLAGR
ncbi:carbamoyltransferase N-terminal domain-containing protein [Frankia sp. R82]|uniref:carbamoyltransferase N-terminal domain-containing protein n=1 Tax=Frankia sp. R82 TaxID=2950553 RepID=UPI0020447FD0|nr:carbamoyltransferase N-terminal domain-containing protein [Frankia sp. R82]MCM3886595.1 nodulation protein NodU [Frankia sp. R82]